MSTPSSNLITRNAPYSDAPGFVAISPGAKVALPVQTSMWTTATMTYAVIAVLMIIMVWWTTVMNPKTETVDDGIVKTFAFGLYLAAGLAIAMMFSQNQDFFYAWVAVVVALTPALAAIGWSAYLYHDDKRR